MQKNLIAEFKTQAFTQVIFPKKDSDWKPILKEIILNFVDIINKIAKYQTCLVLCSNIKKTKKHFTSTNNIVFIKANYNDTWARDILSLSVKEGDKYFLYNFNFDAWGKKYEYKKDNKLNTKIKKIYKNKMIDKDFILEGGSIESNGKGILLSTSKCIFNRNKDKSKKEIKSYIKNVFGAKKLLLLKRGFILGDDTDSHIDTLARFLDKNTIAFSFSFDNKDEHYEELLAMKKELQELKNLKNKAFKLIALPIPSAIYHKKRRLAGTYTNFLLLNKAVLLPIYGVKEDKIAIKILKDFFKGKREIVPVNSKALIKQNGSLHCMAMHFPKKIKLKGLNK